MYPGDIFRLGPHFFDAGQYGPVFLDLHKFLRHESACGVSIVFEQVDDVFGVLAVLDFRDDFLYHLPRQLAHDIGGIIGIEFLEFPCDFLGG